MVEFRFPEKFLFGTGSSSFQIEGGANLDGKGETIWDYSTREHPERFHNGATTENASYFYENYEKDIAEMKAQGLKSFRFSIAWARILPEGTGRINQAGIDFYNRVIDLLIESGIEPFVDLYHWDLPMALSNIGGFKNKKIIDYFVEFARICFENFGDRVKLWSTMNEPSVFCFAPYLSGTWPPFEKSRAGALLAAHNTLICHYRACKLYHEMNLGGKIGAVIAFVPIYPHDPSGKDPLAAQIQVERGSLWWLDPIFWGKYPETILRECEVYCSAMPEGYAEELLREFEPVDMIGINYYYPAIVAYDETSPMKSNHVENYYVQKGQKFHLYPAGLYDSMMFITKRYNRPEIYLAENGLGLVDDGDYEKNINDTDRLTYLREHLRMLVRSIESGANVAGYYYWSNFDSFEGEAGYSYRFGLTYVDFETGKRERKKSWYYYKKVIADNAVE